MIIYISVKAGYWSPGNWVWIFVLLFLIELSKVMWKKIIQGTVNIHIYL